MSQFTAAYVKTETDEDSSTYYVILKQEGMFLTGVSEQTLREVVPLFNSFEREASIANAISEVLSSERSRRKAEISSQQTVVRSQQEKRDTEK
ncbi:MAG: hypothetical protein ABJB40_14155 [Acidobacteriota bacterium]